MSNGPEQFKNTPENSNEVSQSAQEQLERLKDKERSVELSPDNTEVQAEKARKEALEVAVSAETDSKEAEYANPSRRGPIGKKQSEESFKQTMKQVQSELSPISRTFSKIIHNKTIEKTSETLGKTIARPNAILAGAFVAFVITLLVYTVAKTVGYALSGFETIATFIIGWVLGVVYDYLKVIITGKKF